MIEIAVTLCFKTSPNIGSGAQVGTLADRAFIKDHLGWPYIPATVLKGSLRHIVESIAKGLGEPICDTHRQMCRDPATACQACRVFGSSWIPGQLRFERLRLSAPQYLAEQRERGRPCPRTVWRHGVALSRRRQVAEDALLFTTELLAHGEPLSFSGTLRGPISLQDAAWTLAGLRALSALGRAKSTGLGHLEAEVSVRHDGELVAIEQLRSALQEVQP